MNLNSLFMKRFLFYIAILFLFMVSSCSHDDDITSTVDSSDENESTEISDEIIAINQWIYENLPIYYLWNDQIPEIDYTQENDPEVYFEKLLYVEEDKWSWITSDYAALEDEFNGEPVTMGYDPSFYLYGDGRDVFIVVNFVYPDSPSEEAGLERGDIILSINNMELDTANYYELYSGTAYTVELGESLGGAMGYTGESLNLEASVISNDPAIYHDIFTIDEDKIGYLVYVEFVSGSSDQFLSTLDGIFDEFNTVGITDLIVDLRYNPGGEIDAASYLASEIAPAGIVANQEVLVNMEYNDYWQEYFEYYGTRYADYLSYKFENVATNANLQRVYFLTTEGTASASELLITGLQPYMDVVLIGEPTYGKYTGAWVIPDDNDEWAMVPIVLKYSNINGYTDFVDGVEPDYIIVDSPISAVPFGDISDPAVAQALSLITGDETIIAMTKSAVVSPYTRITIPDEEIAKRNLFVPRLDVEE